MNAQIIDEPGHLTPVIIPEEMRVIPGVETHHEEHETLMHVQELQNHGIDAQALGTAALASQTKTPFQGGKFKPKDLGFYVVGSDNPKILSGIFEEKLRQRKELKNAA